ncbi:type IV pilus biogenesis/stability protein PilW [Massilia sp. Dwa41.01b]|uniref:type IV pilus biogenesis/stability protein PilW n=1 Tax=Massilia sp. Dwa41.01b TaxID=2709302 RepID=UPI001600EF42|nr:type IV pilus biogenesis/stability protein PilW [Massilia sp. Dwa41.01b]QNA91111.1 type IV pilus biogenesis/stability protein PilW [Massilia sp. Dwa41.01b]QNB00692.1 type IV pilus biogenesis/stability protein PilW [Massilia sp. Se16.2.3]
MKGKALAARLVAASVLALLTACAGTGTGGGELKTASDQTTAEKRAFIRVQLAVGYYQQGKYEIALDEIKQALKADPNYAEAYGMRALIYTAMNELRLAESNYEQALRLAPNNPELANNYGSFLCQSANRPLDAMRYFEQALNNRSYATPVSAQVNAAQCSFKTRNVDAAERYLLNAVRINPDLPAVNAGLARVYYERRDYQRAGFFIHRLTELSTLDNLPADALWLALRVQRKLGERSMEASLVAQLRRRFPGSPEYLAYERGAFDE